MLGITPSGLRIPQSFAESTPEEAKTALRRRVSRHQYRILPAVTALRGARAVATRSIHSPDLIHIRQGLVWPTQSAESDPEPNAQDPG